MFLKKLKLQNFRNYSSIDFEFKTGVTVLLGDNAQGKSNFLESIYFLSTTKSPKADSDSELIKKGENVGRVEGEVDTLESYSAKLEIVIVNDESGFTKRSKVNGLPKKVVDYIGNLSVVSFSPEDINLVTGPPSLRRWHIDLTLSQIDKSYKNALTNYGEVVIRKNHLLKMIREGEGKIDELDFWVKEQLQFGEIISRKRRTFFEFLGSSEKNFGPFIFEYDPNPLSRERLFEYQPREIAAAASLIGPHRDDFKFMVGVGEEVRNLSRFGSRGEHRTAVLDLKLAECSFMEEVLGSRPILLLDDVFSELDTSHREHVLNLIFLQQTIIASVELDPIVRKKLKDATFIHVDNGSLAETVEK